jgi:hypothetical protein
MTPKLGIGPRLARTPLGLIRVTDQGQTSRFINHQFWSIYTCGAMRHNDQIILPYAVSDTYSNFATIKIAALMQAMS